MGFVAVREDDLSDGREAGDVSLRAQADYRKVEDPEWLERELLRADDGYPTSRGAVVVQSFRTGDYLGLTYAATSKKTDALTEDTAYVNPR